MINASQKEAVRSNIEIASKTRELASLEQQQKIEQAAIALRSNTAKLKDKISVELLASNFTVKKAEHDNKLAQMEADRIATQLGDSIVDIKHKADLSRQQLDSDFENSVLEAAQERKLGELKEETAAIVARFTAAAPGFAEALTALSNKETMVQVAKAWSIQTAIGGENISDALNRVFKGTPLQGLTEKIAAMATNGSSLVSPTATS